MRWFWICVGLSALAACSHEEAPSTDVGSQSQAVVAAAKPAPSSEGRALPSAGVPPAVSAAHGKPLSPDDERVSAESARRRTERRSNAPSMVTSTTPTIRGRAMLGKG